jgi:hypothetical protein
MFPPLETLVNVRALIGPMSSAAAREAIERLLAAASRGNRSAIAASRCDHWEEVLGALAAEPFDMLIAEFGAASPAIDRLFRLQPKLSVIEVDLAGGTTNIHVFDVGSEALVRLAEWLSREAGLARSNDSIARITHAWPQLSVAANGPNEEPDAILGPEAEHRPEQAEAAPAGAFGRGDTDTREPDVEALRSGARLASTGSAPPSIRWVEPGVNWYDIVLPPPIEAELRSIPSHVRHAETVWETWGFGRRIPYGQGTAALFAGPSGTGKTMAARIIARELGWPLFQVDLAQTVSKHIGETVKAIDRIFDFAGGASAVLLFEDIDALFGSRSEAKTADDRYAKLEVGYLLQRIEAYRGVAILPTNRKEYLDVALLRRLRFIVDFPMPDAENRLAIWTRMFPEEAPVADDVDVSLLARQLPLSGADIKRSVVNAAFKAAEDGGVIRMRHLVGAAEAELTRLGLESAGQNLTRLPLEPGTQGARALSAAALFDTTMALARRIRESTGLDVHVGSPLRREMGSARVALTLVHLQPNPQPSDTAVFRPPPFAPVTGAAPQIGVIPFDLHYLITCYRAPGPVGVQPPEPSELVGLGEIIRSLHKDAVLTGSVLPGQDVRLSPLSCSPEDMNQLWGLFAEEPFRTSIVYRASPVFIEASTQDEVPPAVDEMMIAALDAVTGIPIGHGVRVRIQGLIDQPTVNPSGMLVFNNLPEQPHYIVEVDGRCAGYPFVERFTFTAPPPGNKDPAGRRRDVLLLPGPDYPFAPGTTLVRGVAMRGSVPVEGASISALPVSGGASFTTRTVANGEFALALRLPPLGTYEAEAPVSVTIMVQEGADTRSFVRPIANGRSHTFGEPLDITGTNDPGFSDPLYVSEVPAVPRAIEPPRADGFPPVRSIWAITRSFFRSKAG